MRATRSRACPHVFDANLPVLRYGHLTDPEAAHRVIGVARRQAPIAIGAYGPEVLSYEAVRTVLRDDRFVTAHGLGLDVQGITSGPLWDRATRSILSLDGDAHHRLRRLVSKAFAPRGAERMRSLIVEIINDLVGSLTVDGRCDVVSDIARPFSAPVICAMLGVPRVDWQLMVELTDEVKKVFGWNVANDGPAILAAWEKRDAYLDGLVNRRLGLLSDDLISDLIRADEDGDRLTREELIMLGGTLLGAGTDTTRHQLAAAVQVLSAHPDQWALVAQHPELAGNAVHELMRYFPVVFATIRRAVEDVDLAGVRIPAGTLVVANTAAANRDPEVYQEPDRVDITREDPSAMLTFGGGTHYCLGVHLARVELTEALRAITQRISNPRLVGPVPWEPIRGITGPITLPLEFDVATL